jgi:hypothetical protein
VTNIVVSVIVFTRDLDLGLLLDWNRYPTARGRFEARLALGAMLAAALQRNDLGLVGLNDAPPRLARAIVTAGQRLLVADADADLAFVRTTMLRAADLEPFLQRTRRVKLAALERPAAPDR